MLGALPAHVNARKAAALPVSARAAAITSLTRAQERLQHCVCSQHRAQAGKARLLQRIHGQTACVVMSGKLGERGAAREMRRTHCSSRSPWLRDSPAASRAAPSSITPHLVRLRHCQGLICAGAGAGSYARHCSVLFRVSACASLPTLRTVRLLPASLPRSEKRHMAWRQRPPRANSIR